MAVPMRVLPEYLMALMAQVEPSTTVLEVLSAFLLAVLRRNNGNRTKTATELRIPLRTFRHRIWHLEALGYEVPEPRSGAGSYARYVTSKKERKITKKTRLAEL